MKKFIRNIMILLPLFLVAITTRAGEVTIVTKRAGVVDNSAGIVSSSVANGICTLTVIPAAGNYLTVDGLSAVKTADGGQAQSRSNIPGVDVTPIVITPTDASADPSGVTTYTLPMPSADYGVLVTADFSERQDIANAVITLSDMLFFHDGNAKEPIVRSVVLNNVTLSKSDYSVSYENNVLPGEASVKLTGLRTYRGEAVKNFTIGELSTVLFTVAPTTSVFADKVVTITAPDLQDGDKVFFSYYNYDTKEASEDAEYTAPFTLSEVGKYIVKARVCRGDKAGMEYSSVVYVLKQPFFSPESGKYDRERQVRIINLPQLPAEEQAYPQVWYQEVVGGQATAYKRYYVGDAVTVASTTTINAYVEDQSSNAAILKSNVFSATYTLPAIEDYQLTVAGVKVNTLNKENVLGDVNKSVRYDADNHVLTLNGANIGSSKIANGIETSQKQLTIHLVGTNTLTSGTYGVYSARTGTVTFTTPENAPGKLHFVGPADGNDIFGLAPEFGNMQLSDHWITIKPTGYDLIVDGTTVNSANYNDVLGDGTVKYNQLSHTLVLDNAHLSSVKSSLDSLRIHLMNNSTISNSQAEPIQSTKSAKLRFTTTPNAPGSLVVSSNNGKWVSDLFTIAPYEYGLKMEALSRTSVKIATFIPITPIVEDDGSGVVPEMNVDFSTDCFKNGDDYVDLANTVINNVLYTLPEGTAQFDEGDETFDNPSGIILKVQMTEEDVDNASAETPGSSYYADKFKGITFQIPAGTGHILVVAETGGNAVLNVRIGDDAPFSISNVEFSDTTRVPFEIAVPAFVRVYLSDAQAPAPARSTGLHRERVKTGHVKISNLGLSNSALVNTNVVEQFTVNVISGVKLFVLPESAYTFDGAGIELSTIEVNAPSGTFASRGDRAARSERVQMPITELSPSVFGDVNKTGVLWVNLSGTEIADLTVNRDAGVFEGFGDYTLIYLPEGNGDGGEPNVIVNNTCSDFRMYDSHNFMAPKAFNAVKADASNVYVANEPSTVYLPFAIPASQAADWGSFSLFESVSGPVVIFKTMDSASDVEAYTPYFFELESDNLVANDVQVAKTPSAQTPSSGFIGTCNTIRWETADPSVYLFAYDPASDQSQHLFVRAEAGASVLPFHAYLKTTSSLDKLNAVFHSDETTGISTVGDVPAGTSVWHTIDGLRLSDKPSKPGMYILNNKKVVVK